MNIPIYSEMDKLRQENSDLKNRIKQWQDSRAEIVSKDLLIDKMGKELEKYETAFCISVSKKAFYVFLAVVLGIIIAYLVGC